MNKLVLFDIDKTLIRSLRSHDAAFSEAIKKVYGVNITVDKIIDIINRAGTTDQRVIVEALKEKGLEEELIKYKLKQCTEVMVECFKKNIENEEIVVLDGVRELLGELNRHNILIGLVTGNLEPIARSKLEKVGLNHYFTVGGFGSDDINRTNLVRIAIKKAKENFDFKFNDNVFLFGDTPRDIKAGKEARVKTVGVATGIYSKEQLKNARADFVLENLKNKNKVLEIIL